MKAKYLVHSIIITILILFFALYFSTIGGYYQYNDSKKNILTEEAIERFEQDVEEGKKIDAQNYIPEQVDYNNRFSKIGVNLSNFIQKGFNKMMEKLFKELEQAVNNG